MWVYIFHIKISYHLLSFKPNKGVKCWLYLIDLPLISIVVLVLVTGGKLLKDPQSRRALDCKDYL